MAQSLTGSGLAWLLPRAVWKGATGWFTTKITNYFIAGRSCRESARAGRGATRTTPTGTGGSGGGEAGRGAPAVGTDVSPRHLSPSWGHHVPFSWDPIHGGARSPQPCTTSPGCERLHTVLGGCSSPRPPRAWCLHPAALPQLWLWAQAMPRPQHVASSGKGRLCRAPGFPSQGIQWDRARGPRSSARPCRSCSRTVWLRRRRAGCRRMRPHTGTH